LLDKTVPSGTTAERVSQRAQLLLEHAKDMVSAGTLPADLVDMREYRFKNISEGYFLLNEAYKSWRISDGHNTERPKIAALQCVAIARYQPFFPLVHPVNEADPAAAKPNEMFALSYALGILEIDFVPNSPARRDFWLRLLDVISSASAQTLEGYSNDQTHQIDQPLENYVRQMREKKIHPDDRAAISSLICIFELLSAKRARLVPGLPMRLINDVRRFISRGRRSAQIHS
jgi:hypothetical protein